MCFVQYDELEELAEFICSFYCNEGYCAGQCSLCDNKDFANYLINCNYRKILENTVVLTKELYDSMVDNARWVEEMTRKETAREILAELQGYYHQPSDTIIIDIDDFYKLAKQYHLEEVSDVKQTKDDSKES